MGDEEVTMLTDQRDLVHLHDTVFQHDDAHDVLGVLRVEVPVEGRLDRHLGGEDPRLLADILGERNILLVVHPDGVDVVGHVTDAQHEAAPGDLTEITVLRDLDVLAIQLQGEVEQVGCGELRGEGHVTSPSVDWQTVGTAIDISIKMLKSQ